MTLTLSPVKTLADKRAFYRFAWRVYHQDTHWVPHLWPQRKAYLDRTAAFFSYGEGDFWLARRGREIVGTVGAAIDHARNRDTGTSAAYYGFFEVLPDGYDVACAMWDRACEWARERGMGELRGPHSFTVDEEAGFLVDGFKYAPAIMMSHSPPYYAEFAERYGFVGGREHVAYRLDVASLGPELSNASPALHRIAKRAAERHGPNAVRHARLAEWDQEIVRLHRVYNRSLAVLPGFVPIELAEFESQAQALKPMLDPELVLIAQMDGRAVGFALGLPNLNEALQRANGLRHPWDYLRFALARRAITGASFKILALDPDYWGYGLDALMMLEMGKAISRKGYTWVDASVTGVDNPQTNKIGVRFGGTVYRRYREYCLSL
jgi:GNAT superfamily N-acetyltransferase